MLDCKEGKKSWNKIKFILIHFTNEFSFIGLTLNFKWRFYKSGTEYPFQAFAKKFVLISKVAENLIILHHHLFKYPRLCFNEDDQIPSLSSQFRKVLTFSSKKYKNDKFLTWKQFSVQWPIHWERSYATDEWYDLKCKPETLVNFPHRNLKHAIKACKMLSVEPFDEKKVQTIYERSLFLYNQFMRDDLLLDEWLLYLNKISDDDVKVGLFGHRLGWKCGRLDKNLWKHYMEFLKEEDSIVCYR